MKMTAFLLTILLVSLIPLSAGAAEVGVIFGGSQRVAKNDEPAAGSTRIDESFSFSNSSFDFYYAFELDPSTMFKLRAGRIEGPIGFLETEVRNGVEVDVRRDVEGEVQHLSGVVEYRFSEPFGSTGLYGGIGLYRHEAPEFTTATDYGFVVGLTGDFPLSRRYGVILDAGYHFTRHDFNPRYFTLGAGVRISFD